MEVVMGLAHTITVLNYGEVLAEGTTRRDPGQPAGARGLPQDLMLVLENVDAHYGKSHVLHGVSIEVRAGEVVGLLGRNGVGKTTTLKTIMGMARRTGGRITFEGRDLHGVPPHGLRRPRHRLGARGAADLPPAHRARESANRARPRRHDARPAQCAARESLRVLPDPEGAAQSGRRHLVGRRAADARDRPRDDARAEDHPARRADRRAHAAHGRADPARSCTRSTARAWPSSWSSRTCR